MALTFHSDRIVRTQIARPRHKRRLMLETLENRCVLSGTSCGLPEVAESAKLAAVEDLQVTASRSLRVENNLGTLDDRVDVNGWVGWNDRSDTYRFELETSASTSIQLSQLWSDLDLTVYDARGNEIGSSDRPYTYSESFSAQLGPGVYYVSIYPYQAFHQSAYRLTVDVQPTQPAVTPPVNSVPDLESPDPSAPVDSVDVFPDVAYYGGSRQWNVNAINAPEVWAQGYTGEGVVVAVIDTGVDLDHSDLISNIWTNSGEIAGNGIDDDRNGFIDDVHGWDFAGNDSHPNDVNGHGTHVAGIIASQRNSFGTTGIAYDAQIMPVQVLGASGSGSIYDVAAGIRYAVDNGADVINLSLGSSATSSVISSALSYAYSNDVFVVAASGNSGASLPDYPARYARQYENVLSVGAHSSSDVIASFSNSAGNGVTQVDAPGVSVYSAYAGNRAATLSGTSMAAPHVAALAALALDANPNLSATQLRELIVDTADQRIGRSDAEGGINAARTVAQAAGVVANSPRSSSATSNTIAANEPFVRIRFRILDAASVVHVQALQSDATINDGTAINDVEAVSQAPGRRPISLVQTTPHFLESFQSEQDLRTSPDTVGSILMDDAFLEELQAIV